MRTRMQCGMQLVNNSVRVVCSFKAMYSRYWQYAQFQSTVWRVAKLHRSPSWPSGSNKNSSFTFHAVCTCGLECHRFSSDQVISIAHAKYPLMPLHRITGWSCSNEVGDCRNVAVSKFAAFMSDPV